MPSEVLTRLILQLQGTGIFSSDFTKAADLLAEAPQDLWAELDLKMEKAGVPRGEHWALMTEEEQALAEGLAQFSKYIQRMYRYYDLCATELYEVLVDGEGGLDHLRLEFRQKEVLSASYRILGYVVNSIRPGGKSLDDLEMAVEQEFEVIRNALFIIFWAFSTKAERMDYLKKFGNPKWAEDEPEILLPEPVVVLDWNESATERIQQYSPTFPFRGVDIGRTCFEPALMSPNEWQRLRKKSDMFIYQKFSR